MRLTHSFGAAMTALAMIASPALAQDNAGAPQRGQSGRAVELSPYIEVSQVVLAELSPGDDVLTYTQVAAGVDAVLTGRNSGGSVSLRYERNISYGDDQLDSDTISGVARGYMSIVPNTVTLEAGALASRTTVDGSGGTSANPLVVQDQESRIYSAYAGPNVTTRAGDVHVNALGRVGYTRVESPDAIVTTAGAEPLDVFDDSVTYRGEVHLATKPGEPLPVGIAVGGGIFQEDISNLDQRVRDIHWRSDVTVPVSPTLAVVGGVGYEDVEISSRDVLRDANGAPVVGSDGRFVTDTSAPRRIAFDVDGLIWDAGVIWRPSRRTSLEAHVGRRYGSTTYYGSFAWAPSPRSAFNLSVYDGVTGFGGVLTDSLAALPTEFEATRNALTGDFSGCVAGETGANCLGVFGSIRSSTFRGRGVQASYSRQVGRYSAAVAAGYDRRKFIAAPGTILAAANGVTDESYYITTSVSGELGANAGFTVGSYVNWFESGFADGGDVVALGSSASYRRTLTPNLSARAAVSLDYLDSDLSPEDIKAASALLGLRYDF